MNSKLASQGRLPVFFFAILFSTCLLLQAVFGSFCFLDDGGLTRVYYYYYYCYYLNSKAILGLRA